MKRILLALVVLLGFQNFAFAQTLPSGSLWKNQRGSTLEVFFVDPSGAFQGTFVNRAAGFQCQGTPYPASGTARNGIIAFSVNFTQCSTHTIWFGGYGADKMNTGWVLIYVPPHGPAQKRLGSDFFTRVR